MTPRTSEQYDQIRDQREGEILLAALRLFARQGFKATRISEITELAGASHGLFYHYFDSKEALFNALVDMAVDSSNGFLINIEAMDLSPLEKIHAIAEDILLSLKETDDSAFFFLLIVQAAVSEAAVQCISTRILTGWKPICWTFLHRMPT
jgi:AcrR family transcriptional regulator